MDNVSGTTAREPGPPVTVGQFMRPAVTTVERHAHLAAAAYLMKHGGDSALVVTTDDESRRPVGIVTEADIMRTVADGKDPNVARIDNLVGRDPVIARPGTTVDEAASLMLSAGVQHLPIVDDGRLVGIVDLTDACRALLNAVPRPPRETADEPARPHR
jgi:CBS domain-containing protein